VAGQAADVLGDLGDAAHVGLAAARVLGGDVGAAQAVDQPAHGAQQLGGLVAARVGDDHRLAAAERQVGQRRLVGHAAGEAQHVGECLGVAVIGEDAQAAQGRAASGIVDGDDGAQAARLVAAEDDLLVVVELGVVEDRHGGTPS
jgi:hypothetical protein